MRTRPRDLASVPVRRRGAGSRSTNDLYTRPTVIRDPRKSVVLNRVWVFPRPRSVVSYTKLKNVLRLVSRQRPYYEISFVPYLHLISMVPKKRHPPLGQSSPRLHRVHFPPNPHRPLRCVVPCRRSPRSSGCSGVRIPSRVASRLCSFACAYGPSSGRKRKFARSAWELAGTRRWSQPWLRFQGENPRSLPNLRCPQQNSLCLPH
jgi:hypothetical protein